jgi:hypothetical protein
VKREIASLPHVVRPFPGAYKERRGFESNPPSQPTWPELAEKKKDGHAGSKEIHKKNNSDVDT